MTLMRKPDTGQTAVFLPVLIIAFVAFAVYANALQNGFIYDDHSQILKNHLIRDIRNIPEIFRRSAWTFEGAPPTSNYYRPMLNILYMFTYYISGLKPWGYHLVNILFHAANSVLVFLVASKLLGPPEQKVKAEAREKSHLILSLTLNLKLSLPPFCRGSVIRRAADPHRSSHLDRRFAGCVIRFLLFPLFLPVPVCRREIRVAVLILGNMFSSLNPLQRAGFDSACRPDNL